VVKLTIAFWVFVVLTADGSIAQPDLDDIYTTRVVVTAICAKRWPTQGRNSWSGHRPRLVMVLMVHGPRKQRYPFPAMAPLIPLVSSERYRFSVIALKDNVSAFSYRDLLEGKPIIRSFGVIVAVSLLI
jgi:hypothetical protein